MHIIIMRLENVQETRGKPINIKISFAIRHWPTLKTVLMVEKAIQESDGPISIAELKRRLKTKIMDQTLRVILAYLEDKGSISIGSKGIVWIENNEPKFLKMLEKCKRIEL